MISLLGLDPATYRPHPLHGPERVYTETNCWTDVLLELVPSLGMVPEAMLGATAAVDFELDQWTFFKPTPDDLWSLYGLDVHEMQPTADLPGQIAHRLGVGHLVMPEVDSWWLPDTVATDYRAHHVKTSIVVEGIDTEAQVLRYFHSAGFHELSGDDYRGVFGIEPSPSPDRLPGYVELVRPGAGPRPEGEALRARARELLAVHLSRRPDDNPFGRFGRQLTRDLPTLLAGDLASFHAYGFANARMAGAAFELLAAHVRWLFGTDGEPVALLLDDVVGGTKMLLFRLARRRAFDVDGVVDPMAAGWAQVVAGLDRLVG